MLYIVTMGLLPPVYFILDDKPIRDARKAPAIIEKQMNAIGLIEEETQAKEDVNQEVLDRLDMAKDY